MKGNTPSVVKFKRQQNQFRGLISIYKSKSFVKNRTQSSESLFRRGLRALLLDCRSSLHPTQYKAILNWIYNQIPGQAPELLQAQTGYQELSGVIIEAKSVPLEKEISWITQRIIAEYEKLNNFRKAASAVELLTFQGKYEKALKHLDDIETRFGASMWLVQLRIAIENFHSGLEGQKKYTQKVRNIYKSGLLGFVAYHTSVRNEDKTTLAKFKDDIISRIDRHKYYDQPARSYMRYRLVGIWPINKSEQAEVLRIEQSHSIIDIYETLISYIQHIIREDNDPSITREISESLKELECIDDFRLRKASLILGASHKTSGIPNRDRSISDLLILGSIDKAILSSRKSDKGSYIDAWEKIYSGFAKAHIRKKSVQQNSCLPTEIEGYLGLIESRHAESKEAYTSVHKLVTNLSGFPSALGILAYLSQIKKPDPGMKWKPWLIGLNCPTYGIEDHSHKSIEKNNNIKYHSATCDLWGLFYSRDRAIEKIDSRIENIFRSAGKVEEKLYDEALSILDSIEQSDFLNHIKTSLLLHCYHLLGERQSAVSLIANEGSKGEEYRFFLPIVASLEAFDWIDYKPLQATLAPSVALHMLWSRKEQDNIASLLRFAVGSVLRKSAMYQPSKLVDHVDKYTHHELVYFLKYVCVPEILDVSRVLKGTREVMEERQAVCASLRILDSKNSDVYAQEVSDISNQQALDEGQYIVDRSRIHVDTEALKRWAEKEISEDHARYQDLVDVDVGDQQDFDDIIKEFLNPSSSQLSNFTPESEADLLLYDILRRLNAEFLSNPSFGLDFYLSKRIRHQSFTGLIRGPAESCKVITTRESESKDYHRNDHWLDQFSLVCPETIETLNTAFKKFSEEFDDILISAKDNNFHIRSAEKPDGLIFLDLTPRLIFLTRAFFKLDCSMPSFMQVAINLFWASLDLPLQEIRSFIKNNIKVRIVDAFDQLRYTIRKHAENDPVSSKLDVALGNCSTDVQKALDDAAQWFSKADLESHKRMFVLEQVVRIAIDSALKCQRGFSPNITRTVDNGDFKTVSTSLVFVHDVLFVALDNIRAHSGLKEPNVEIYVSPDLDKELLTICITSDAKSSQRQRNEEKLTEIRNIIEEKKLQQRTRSEGGSGIIKLAAVIHQSRKGEIDFGYNDDGRFQLKVVYSFIIQSTEDLGEINDSCIAC